MLREKHARKVMVQADLLAKFRSEVLDLPSMAYLRSHDLHKVPWTYCFSPTLVPR